MANKKNDGNCIFDGENAFTPPPIGGEEKPAAPWYSRRTAPKWSEDATYRASIDTLVDYVDKHGRQATMMNFILVDTVTEVSTRKGEALTESRAEFLTEALGNATGNKYENLGEILEHLKGTENYIVVGMKYSPQYGWQIKF